MKVIVSKDCPVCKEMEPRYRSAGVKVVDVANLGERARKNLRLKGTPTLVLDVGEGKRGGVVLCPGTLGDIVKDVRACLAGRHRRGREEKEQNLKYSALIKES